MKQEEPIEINTEEQVETDKIPKCLECGEDILKKGDLFCLKCEIKHYREYLQDIDGAMNEPSNDD
ncbi:hypothetical protein HY837_00540 [archaeon]|nr:hypothetical protein [archaeon]